SPGALPDDGTVAESLPVPRRNNGRRATSGHRPSDGRRRERRPREVRLHAHSGPPYAAVGTLFTRDGPLAPSSGPHRGRSVIGGQASLPSDPLFFPALSAITVLGGVLLVLPGDDFLTVEVLLSGLGLAEQLGDGHHGEALLVQPLQDLRHGVHRGVVDVVHQDDRS